MDDSLSHGGQGVDGHRQLGLLQHRSRGQTGEGQKKKVLRSLLQPPHPRLLLLHHDGDDDDDDDDLITEG